MKKIIKTISEIFNLLKSEWHKVCLLMILMMISSIFAFIPPLIVQKIIDSGLIGDSSSELKNSLIILVILYISTTIIELVKEIVRISLYRNIKVCLEMKALEKFIKIDMSYFQDKNPASIHAMLEDDIANMTCVVDSDTFTLLSGLLSAIGGSIALVKISPQLSVALLFFFPIEYMIILLFSKFGKSYGEKLKEVLNHHSEKYGEMLSGIRELRLFKMQKNWSIKIAELIKERTKYSGKLLMLMKETTELQSLLIKLITVLIYSISSALLLNDDISIGGIVAFQTYSIMLFNPIMAGVEMFANISQLSPSFEHYNNFMNYTEESDGDKEISKNGKIEFCKINFSYNEKCEIFKDAEFCFESGTHNAIIGLNGSGKTTLLNLLLKFIIPKSGEIIFDNKNILSYNNIYYRSLFSVVSQDVFLFNASIKENVCLGMDATDMQVNEVLELVGMEEFIKKRGINQLVGERGLMLSGGQRQKVALARAILYDRPIVLFDEVTSNLDSETIDMMKRLFDTKLRNKTVICITHGNLPFTLFDTVWRLEEKTLKKVQQYENRNFG